MAENALLELRQYLPACPEIAAAIATITLQLQYLRSKDGNDQFVKKLLAEFQAIVDEAKNQFERNQSITHL